MRTTLPPSRARLALACTLLALTCGLCRADVVTFLTTTNGDAGYAWNSKYGPYGYTVGDTNLPVGLYFGPPYGNDYTVGIMEIPIMDLHTMAFSNAFLRVYSNGFGTGYYYGSASLWHVNPSATPTGNPVTDGVGPNVGTPVNEYTIWDSDGGYPEGWYAFDVTAHVVNDLAAGRDYSTFAVGGSRDTGGSIRSAEYPGDFAPRITAEVVPEPATCLLLLGAAAWFYARRRRSA